MPVRYTGLLVLVGIGVGLSSYVIYKILARFGKGNNGSSDIKRKKLPKRIRSKSFELETPDSGFTIGLSSCDHSADVSPDNPSAAEQVSNVRLRKSGIRRQENVSIGGLIDSQSVVQRPTSINITVSESEALNLSTKTCRDSVISTNSVDTILSTGTAYSASALSSDLGFSSECQSSFKGDNTSSNYYEEKSRKFSNDTEQNSYLLLSASEKFRLRTALGKSNYVFDDSSSRESTPADINCKEKLLQRNGENSLESRRNKFRPHYSLPVTYRPDDLSANSSFDRSSRSPSVSLTTMGNYAENCDLSLEIANDEFLTDVFGQESEPLFPEENDNMDIVQQELKDIQREINEMSEALSCLQEGHVDSNSSLNHHLTDDNLLSECSSSYLSTPKTTTEKVADYLAADHSLNSLSHCEFAKTERHSRNRSSLIAESPLLSRVLGSLKVSPRSRSESWNESASMTPSSDCYMDDSDWNSSRLQLNQSSGMKDGTSACDSVDASEQLTSCKISQMQSVSGMSSGNFLSSEKSWEVKNINVKYNIVQYAKNEWKSNTEKASIMRRGYQHIPVVIGLDNLRQVRGDNYCAIRATLYQAFVNGIDITNNWGSLSSIMSKLEIFQSKKHSYLLQWSFANRLPYNRDGVMHKAFDCLQCLYFQSEVIASLATYELREEYLVSLLNRLPEVDLQLMEAVKLLMMLRAIELYDNCNSGIEVPVFVWLMFARDTASTPEQFFRNHLNVVGDTGGLELIDMYLLGHTLALKIAVFRPSQFGKEDFVSHYPSDGADTLPKVYLIAEDDRHYNIVVS